MARPSVSMPKAIKSGLDDLEADAASETDPAKKAKKAYLAKVIRALISKIQQIPSSATREMLFGQVAKVLNLAAQGDLDSALAAAESLMGLIQKCADACDRILKNVSKLRMLDVQGPAGLILKAIAEAAILAMNGASSLQALETIADMTDRAVVLGKKLEGLDPKSEEYQDYSNELADILQGLLQMTAKAEDPMGSDYVATNDNAASRIVDSMQQLRNNTTDANALNQITQLQQQLFQVVHAGQAGDGSQSERAREGLERALRLASEGNLAGAIASASACTRLMADMAPVQAHLDRRLERITTVGDLIAAPPRRLLDEIAEKLDQRRKEASSLEELHEIDQLIEQALAAAGKCGKGHLKSDPGYLELMKLNKRCGPKAPASPGMAQDSFGSGPKGPSGPKRPGGVRPPGSPSPGAAAGPLPSPGATSPGAATGPLPSPGATSPGAATGPLPGPGAPRPGSATGPLPSPGAPAASSAAAVGLANAVADLRSLSRRLGGELADGAKKIAAMAEAAGAGADERTLRELRTAVETLVDQARPLTQVSPGSQQEAASVVALTAGEGAKRIQAIWEARQDEQKAADAAKAAAEQDETRLLAAIVVPAQPSPGAPSPGA